MIPVIHPVLNAEQWATVNALDGRFNGRNGSHPYQRLVRQIDDHSLTVFAAQVDRHTWLQALVLCGIAACRGWEKEMCTVVCVFNRSIKNKENKETKRSKGSKRKHDACKLIRLPRWRDLPNHIRLAYALAAGMNVRDAVDYTPISLNLSKDDAAQHPDALTEKIRKRLFVALDVHIPFVIERDDKGRSHVHAIFLGTLTRKQRDQLKAAGGKIKGNASQFQLRAPVEEGIIYCIGWTRYMQKEAKAHIPNEMRNAGEVLYEQVRALINEINTAPTTRNPKPATSTHATRIPLEEYDPISSPRHGIGAAILKTKSSEDEFDRQLDELRRDLHMDDIDIYAPWPAPDVAGAHPTTKMNRGTAMGAKTPQSDYTSDDASIDEIDLLHDLNTVSTDTYATWSTSNDAGANLATKMTPSTAVGDNTLQSNHTSNCANMDELDQWLDQMFEELMQEAA